MGDASFGSDDDRDRSSIRIDGRNVVATDGRRTRFGSGFFRSSSIEYGFRFFRLNPATRSFGGMPVVAGEIGDGGGVRYACRVSSGSNESSLVPSVPSVNFWPVTTDTVGCDCDRSTMFFDIDELNIPPKLLLEYG